MLLPRSYKFVFLSLLLLGGGARAGSISGVVTNENNGQGIEVLMLLYDLNQGIQELEGVVSDPATGSYAFTDLPASDGYIVKVFDASSLNLIAEVYNDIPCPRDCDVTIGTPINLGPDDDLTGIDFALATGATIRGRVTRSDNGTGVGSTVVGLALSNGLGGLAGVAGNFTDTDGFYELGGLIPGTYKVFLGQMHDAGVMNADGLQGEVYDNVSCPCVIRDGDDVVVGDAGVAENIDFVLDPATLSLSGRVTDTNGTPIVGIEVFIHDTSVFFVNDLTIALAGKEVTDADGRLTFAVNAGEFLINTSASGMGFIDEWFDDVPFSTPVERAPTLTVTGSRTDIDFELSGGARIEGTVTREASGEPVDLLLVVANNLTDGSSYGDETDANGNYSIAGVTPGTYTVVTFGGAGFNLTNQYYPGQLCQPCATQGGDPVNVAAGQIVTGIDFSMQTGGGIAGVVESEFGVGLPGVLIEFFDAQNAFAGLTFTRELGSYSLQGLIPGDYTLRTARAGQFSLINEFYDDVPCIGECDPASGQRVTVPAGNPLQGFDFALSEVPVLVGDNPDDLDSLGSAVAISGDVLAIGVPGDDDRGENAGAVLVFRRHGGQYLQESKLYADDPAPGDRFGTSVAVDGNRVLVGAVGEAVPGKATASVKQSAYIMNLIPGGGFNQLAQLVASNLTNPDASGFGSSVSIAGSTIAVGAPSAQKDQPDGAGDPSGSASGAVVVFDFDGANLTQSAVLNDPAGLAGDGFGAAVDVSQSMIAAGAPNKRSNNLTAGAVALIAQVGNNLFSAPDLVTGNGAADGDRFGASVSLDGDMLAIGAPGRDSTAANAGAVYLFEDGGASFTQSLELTPYDAVTDMPLGRGDGRFGESVSLRRGAVAIGAGGEDGEATATGAAYVFTGAEADWQLADRVLRAGGASGDGLGAAIAIDEGTLIIGAPGAPTDGVVSGIVLGASNPLPVFVSGFETGDPG